MPEQANPLRRYELRGEETLGVTLGDSTESIPSRKAPLPGVRVTVPQTDTRRRVEYTKARERTLAKELGKFAP